MFLKSPGEIGSSIENKPEIQTPLSSETSVEKQTFSEPEAKFEANQSIEESPEIIDAVPEESTVETTETLEQFEHAKLVNDKKAEAAALEHLLTDGEITGDNAYYATEAAEDLAAEISK